MSPETGNRLDPAVFGSEAISEETRRFNEELIKVFTPLPNCWEVGAQTVRDSRARGEGPFHWPRRQRERALSRLGEREAVRFRCESSRRRIRKAFISTSTVGGWCLVRRTCRTRCSSV